MSGGIGGLAVGYTIIQKSLFYRELNFTFVYYIYYIK